MVGRTALQTTETALTQALIIAGDDHGAEDWGDRNALSIHFLHKEGLWHNFVSRLWHNFVSRLFCIRRVFRRMNIQEKSCSLEEDRCAPSTECEKAYVSLTYCAGS